MRAKRSPVDVNKGPDSKMVVNFPDLKRRLVDFRRAAEHDCCMFTGIGFVRRRRHLRVVLGWVVGEPPA